MQKLAEGRLNSNQIAARRRPDLTPEPGADTKVQDLLIRPREDEKGAT